MRFDGCDDRPVPLADTDCPLPDQTPGRREQRKLETRRRLLAAAVQLAAERGLDALRIGDVSDRAGVGFGTIYSYFASKDDLVEAVVAHSLRTAAEDIGLQALQAADAAETASISYRRFLRFAEDEPDVARILVGLGGAEALFETALLPYARETLERGIATGRFAIDDVELALTSVSAAALAAIRGVVEGRLGPESAVAGATMMLRAFGLEPGDAADVAARPLPPTPKAS